jgi:Spy/CpxP family protein refolding chaperone
MKINDMLVQELQRDTIALKQLADLEELASVPPERGGFHFSEWERNFIRDVREQHNRTLDFTEKQRAKIKDIWHAADLRRRPQVDEKSANLFSALSPKRQAEQRARAAKVKLPWET